jgi:hypothetical protein
VEALATTMVNGKSCNAAGNATIDALNPASGAFVWRSCQTAQIYGGITVVPGVLVEGNLAGNVQFLSTATGAPLFSYKTGVTQVQGECAVSGGVVYIPASNGTLITVGQ